MSSFGERLIKGLERLLNDLKDGKPMSVTEIQRIDTPDGPMHIRRKVIYHERNIDTGTTNEAPDILP